MNIEEEIQSVIQYCRSGQMKQAEERCSALLRENENNLKAQWLLLEIYLSQKRYKKLFDVVGLMITTQPNSLAYITELSTILVDESQSDIAQECYLKYLHAHPHSANAHYELALLQKKFGLKDDALYHYQQSLALNIQRPETVHVNIAVIYSELRNESLAKVHLQLALKLKHDYVPALFNLATLYEEWGEQQQALTLYYKILQLAPDNIEVTARIINAKKFDTSKQSELKTLAQRLTSAKDLTQIEKEAGHFALGKAYDDCKQFSLAFHHYDIANAHCAQRSPNYESAAHERYIQTIIRTFNQEWIAHNSQQSHYQPIFISGMFRSGTTLTEQILAAHTDVSSGGELNLLSKIIKKTGYPFPNTINDDKPFLEKIAKHYENGVKALFPNAAVVTDKQPDNFVYLGLLKAIFPQAKFICTIRNPLDVCISVYFQHLGNELPYSNKLLNIAHYFSQYVKLIRYWKSIMGDNLFIVDYDNLVVSQTATTEKLLKFCNLPWQDECLEFYSHKNAVKTASVWQVRQPIYQTSVRRSQHYAQHLREVESYLAKHLPDGYADLLSPI